MFEGTPLVLLTTTGAQSGRRHTTFATYLADGDRILVFASNGGAAEHPDWFHNLQANPEVVVEIGDGERIESYSGTAVVLEGEERDRLYAKQASLVPAFAEYQARTSRVIPVVAIHRNHPRQEAPPEGSIGAFLLQIHGELRRELVAVQRELDEYLASEDGSPNGDRPKPGLGLQLRTHCLTFCQTLTGHHTGEDGALDTFEQQLPAAMVARVRAEHLVVAEMLRTLTALLSDVDFGNAEQIRGELRHLSAELVAHFVYEEEQLVPALAHVPMPQR